jgi:hypothetical protein
MNVRVKVGSDGMATYEIWERGTGNLIGSWTSEAGALAVVRDALAQHGADAFGCLAMIREDSQGSSSVIAEGLDLLERAGHVSPATEQPSASRQTAITV